MGKDFWEGTQTQVALSDRNHGTGKEEAERRGIKVLVGHRAVLLGHLEAGCQEICRGGCPEDLLLLADCVCHLRLTLSRHAHHRRLPVVRWIGWLCLLFIGTNLQTNSGTYKRFQQTQRNSIDKDSAWEYVQIESNNPHQHKRHEPTDECRLD